MRPMEQHAYASEHDWIAARVRAARGFADVSQPELARRLGFSDAKKISRWERGSQYPGSHPTKAELIAITEVLELRRDWFELAMSRGESLEDADVRALEEKVADTVSIRGSSHSAVLRAVREAQQRAQDQAG